MRRTFVDDLLEAMPTPHARIAAAAILGKWAGYTVYVPKPTEASRRERQAENMLRNGMDRGDVVRSLIERFSVSERQAWRDVAKSHRQMTETDGANG
jgi:Mor family transcriptional regulator